MKILHLTLKKKWFDMIRSGEKKEEYREIKEYWCKRFCGKEWFKYEIEVLQQAIELFPDYVTAKNGYSKNAPNITWKHKGIRIGKPNPLWCEPEDINKDVFILKIGKIINP